MANYGAVARRQRSAPALGSECQPLLLSDSSNSSTTTVNDLNDRKNGNGRPQESFFTRFMAHPRLMPDPEDRLIKDTDQETWGSTQLGAPDMVASNLVITLSTA